MCRGTFGGDAGIMKETENIKIRKIDKETYDIWKEIEDTQEVVEILFELIKEEHKKVTLLYVIVSLLCVVTSILVFGG